MHPIVKRSCVFLLSASLLMPVSPALAAPAPVTKQPASGTAAASQPTNAKLSKEAALSIAKRFVQLPEGMELTNTFFRAGDQWRPFPEWSFEWVKKNPDGEPAGPSIGVSIHADSGEITAYNNYSYSSAPVPVAQRLTRDEAQKVAEQFLAQTAPSKVNAVRLYSRDMPPQRTPLAPNSSYFFRFIRVQDDVMVLDNTIEITVNDAGKVTNYQLNWNDKLNLVKPKTILPKEKAAELFRAAAQAKPAYMVPWNKGRGDEGQEATLVYRNPFEFYLDAETGNPLTTTLTPRKDASSYLPVSNKPLAALRNGEAMNQNEAVSFARKLLNIPAAYELKGAYYHENDYRGKRTLWDLQFEKSGKPEERRNVYVALDAKTGDILSYGNDYNYPMTKENAKTLPSDQLKAKALEAVRRLTPTMASQLYLVGSSEGQNYLPPFRVEYRFQRFVNGIMAATGSVHVTFNTQTGELAYYNVDMGPEKYPSQTPAHKSPQEAIDAWLGEAEIELVCVPEPLVDEYGREKSPVDTPRKTRMVYRATITPATQQYAYHAVTGEWVSQETGKPVVLHKPVPTDIVGHPAERELMLMYEYDAFPLVDGKLMPDRQMTRGELIQMMVLAINQGYFSPEMYANRKASFSNVSDSSPYFAYVEEAVDRGLIDKSQKTINLDETITREELADMFVRALGYRKLSGYDSLFASNLTDINGVKHRGAIAIVTALDIMPVQGRQFHPGKSVSRADAAVAFSRFLEKRAELSEQQLPLYKG